MWKSKYKKPNMVKVTYDIREPILAPVFCDLCHSASYHIPTPNPNFPLPKHRQ